jgi:hypothetical protein
MSDLTTTQAAAAAAQTYASQALAAAADANEVLAAVKSLASAASRSMQLAQQYMQQAQISAALFKVAGPWDPTVTYYPMQFVTYRGSSYLALARNSNVAPGTNGNVWLLAAAAASGGGAPVLQSLTLSGNSFSAGAAQGTVIGTIQNTTAGSVLSLTNVSPAGALQISGTQLQVGPSPPGTAGTITFSIVETLTGAVNSPNTTSGLSVSESSGSGSQFDFSSPSNADILGPVAP